MTRAALTCFFLLLLIYLKAQNQEFKVLDATKKENIPGVHIERADKLIAITDYFGAFKIYEAKEDTITFSCIGFKTKTLTFEKIQESVIIELQPDTLSLNPVVITAMSAKELVLKSISKITENYFGVQKHISGFHSLIESKDSIKESKKLTQLDIIQKQSGYKIDFLDTSTSTFTKELIKESLFFDHIISGRGFLNMQNIESWEFDITGYTQMEQNELIVISALYKSGDKVNHSGKLFIDSEDFGIHQIEYNYHWLSPKFKKSEGENLFSKQHQWKGFAFYSKSEPGYTLSNLGYSIKRAVYSESATGNYDLLYKQEIISEFRVNQKIESNNQLADTLVSN